jgi:hypothetical protein
MDLDPTFLSGEERASLAEFLSVVAAHLKVFQPEEWLTHEKAAAIANTANQWEHRIRDRDWYPPFDKPWPPASVTSA